LSLGRWGGGGMVSSICFIVTCEMEFPFGGDNLRVSRVIGHLGAKGVLWRVCPRHLGIQILMKFASIIA